MYGVSVLGHHSFFDNF